MIKTIIVIGIFSSFMVIILGFTDIFTILLLCKGYFVYLASLFWSYLAVFAILAELAHEFLHRFFKRL